MFPTLKPKQDVLVWCWFNTYKVGDIVVFQKNGKNTIKRIQYLHDRTVFVLGDNPGESTDSRHFGEVDIKDVVGKVIYIVRTK